MRNSIYFLLILIFVCTPVRLFAAEIPVSVAEECTTSEKIYFPTQIRTNANISTEQKTDAIMRALGAATTQPNYATQNFKGQWYYEYDSEDAVFAGFQVRNHYLNVAIIYDSSGLITIICNSDNMKQKEKSIHRKAPLWKNTLDSKIRAALSNSLRESKSNKIHLKNLTGLYQNGFVTKEEYEAIKKRIDSE